MWMPGFTLRQIEKEVILKALKFYGNKRDAADALGVTDKTIRNKLKGYDEERQKSDVAIEDRKVKEQERIDYLRGKSDDYYNKYIKKEEKTEEVPETTETQSKVDGSDGEENITNLGVIDIFSTSEED